MTYRDMSANIDQDWMRSQWSDDLCIGQELRRDECSLDRIDGHPK